MTPAGAARLAHEMEHLDALQRMRRIEPYYRWTFDLVRPWLGRRILDAGCGVGSFTVLAAGIAEHVCAADLSAANLEVVRERAGPGVETVQADLESDADVTALADRSFDTVVCLDVVEHVAADVELLRRLLGVVEPGGHLVVKVPACRWLYGPIDVASDHHRRYTPAELRAKAGKAGWRPIAARYMNLFGVPPYWIKSRVLRRRVTFSQTFAPWQLTALARITPLLQRLDRLVGPPIGLSALLVARRP